MIRKTEKRRRGDFGENLCCQFLLKNGYQILERNYLKTYGEVDVIALKDKVVSFVEVKTRKNSDFGYPSEFVNVSKQKRIIRASEAYILENNLDDYFISFDVCEVLTDSNEINYIENAFC